MKQEVKSEMNGETMSGNKGPVVVTGASGFVGSWLVMKLLQAGYVVRATVRDPGRRSLPLRPLSRAHTQCHHIC
jgi:bifunctional dihydroflavonol 4-reductase/flavanone 4-reductase